MDPFIIVSGIVLYPFNLAGNLQGHQDEKDYDESFSQFTGNLSLLTFCGFGYYMLVRNLIRLFFPLIIQDLFQGGQVNFLYIIDKSKGDIIYS